MIGVGVGRWRRCMDRHTHKHGMMKDATIWADRDADLRERERDAAANEDVEQFTKQAEHPTVRSKNERKKNRRSRILRSS